MITTTYDPEAVYREASEAWAAHADRAAREGWRPMTFCVWHGRWSASLDALASAVDTVMHTR